MQEPVARKILTNYTNIIVLLDLKPANRFMRTLINLKRYMRFREWRATCLSKNLTCGTGLVDPHQVLGPHAKLPGSSNQQCVCGVHECACVCVGGGGPSVGRSNEKSHPRLGNDPIL